MRLKILHHVDAKSFWKALFENCVEKVPNFARLIYILKVLPVSNAKVERVFSIIKMVKTDWRSSLSSTALEHLMRITLERPEIDKYCAKEYVQVFFLKPRRQRKQASASTIKDRECDDFDSTDSDSNHDRQSAFSLDLVIFNC